MLSLQVETWIRDTGIVEIGKKKIFPPTKLKKEDDLFIPNIILCIGFVLVEQVTGTKILSNFYTSTKMLAFVLADRSFWYCNRMILVQV